MTEVLLSSRPGETVMAVKTDGILTDFKWEREEEVSLVGQIYRGIVKRSVAAMDAFFVDIGKEKNGFLRKKDVPEGQTLTEGSPIIVRVEKDGTGTKGPLVSGHISIPGRYAVLLAGSSYIGVSRKIEDEHKRLFLKQLGRSICPDGYGMIIRTAAGNIDEKTLTCDFENLARIGEIIKKRFLIGKRPELLYRESDLAVRAFRDYIKLPGDRIITDDRKFWKILKASVSADANLPEDTVLFYEGKQPLFSACGLDEQIEALFQRQVTLPSGGTIVIDPTEALTAIDVNSGTFQGQGMPHEDLAYITNREAAAEIARQIRLRSIGGMILIDFIDMKDDSRRNAVVRALREAIASDHVKTVVLGMTRLGLVEMTRTRMGKSLTEAYFDTCPVCGGRGRILSAEAAAHRIMEALREKEPLREPLIISCHQEVKPILDRWLAETGKQPLLRTEICDTPYRETYSLLLDREG